MEPIISIEGRAAPYRGSNIDTDEIIPARFLYRARRDGFATTLFHDLRLDENGEERSDFILNREPFRDPVVLIVGQNFGCGSSREHAVWALMDSGIHCLIAASFGDIFRSNALENGLVTVTLGDGDIAALQDAVEADAPSTVTVDLPTQTIRGPTGLAYAFDFDPHAKQALVSGLRGIDATLARLEEIMAFEAAHRADTPWAFD